MAMTKREATSRQLGADRYISVKASGTILNPWYELPLPSTFVIGPGPSSQLDASRELTPPCRVELEEHDISLFFRQNEMVFAFTTNAMKARYLVDPLRYYVIYRTFIDYNLIGPVLQPPVSSDFNQVDSVRFKVGRVVRVETERIEADQVVRGFHHEIEDEWLEIAVKSLQQYLRILNPTLYYALAFYLVGCDNKRYFLVEFYKAVEAIENAFESEDTFLKSLAPYGVRKSKYKQFAKLCNDQRIAPLNIGRHAPMPGARLYSVDLRNLLVEPRSRDVFESSTLFCRQVIDGYVAYLVGQAESG